LPKQYEGIFNTYEREFEGFLYERYKPFNNKRRLILYYTVRPLLPRSLQIFLRKRRAMFINPSFPHWPIESRLENLRRRPLKDLEGSDNEIPFIWFWPKGKNFSLCLTHDVETEQGLKNIGRICEIEKGYGLRSCWNFVPERYKIPYAIIDRLKAEGFEIGIHGLNHDGKLFSSKRIFDGRMKRIEKYAREFGADGFRSPSLLRNVEWIKELPFEYDSSFPDTDPYSPQPGGCLSIFPYFIGNVIELPVTLTQDHTLFEILKMEDISIWQQKFDWIENYNGMALLIVHPDYFNIKIEKFYREFLEYTLNKKNLWHALPRDLSHWWRQRDAQICTPNYGADLSPAQS